MVGPPPCQVNHRLRFALRTELATEKVIHHVGITLFVDIELEFQIVRQLLLRVTQLQAVPVMGKFFAK